VFVPVFPLAGVWLFPNLLGPRSMNPLVYLPGRISQIAIIRNLVARLK
jgi:hypothetical protein